MVGKDQIYKTKIKPHDMIFQMWVLGFVCLKMYSPLHLLKTGCHFNRGGE